MALEQDHSIQESTSTYKVKRTLSSDEEILDSVSYDPRFDIFYERRNYYLTNKRVIFRGRQFVRERQQDIPLQNIISINNERYFNVPIAIVGGFIALIGVIASSSGAIVLGIALLAVAYLLSGEKFELKTSNPNVSISMPFTKRDHDIQQFIRHIREVSERHHARSTAGVMTTGQEDGQRTN